MKCRSCNIDINSNLTRCPLCNTKLEGNKSISVFPKINNKSNLLKKILLFISLTIFILFIFIEYIASKKVTISKYILFGLITNYILVTFIVNNYNNILKMLNRYFWIILILLFMWYLVTKSMFITTYLIPALCITILVFNSILIVVKKDYVVKYIKTILLDFVIGLIPLLLSLVGLSNLPVLSYVVVVIDILLVIGMVIFFFDEIVEEVKKIFWV